MDFRKVAKNAVTIKAMQQFHDNQDGEIVFSMSINSLGETVPCALAELSPDKIKMMLIQQIVQLENTKVNPHPKG